MKMLLELLRRYKMAKISNFPSETLIGKLGVFCKRKLFLPPWENTFLKYVLA